MSESNPISDSNGNSTCAQCGAALLLGDTGDLCSECALKVSPNAIASQPLPVSSPSADSGFAVSAPSFKDKNRFFGDYELLEEIARGGMGVVYKARQLSLNRQVALKMILSGQLASPYEVKRFRVESEAAAGLEHPNIVPIYEVGEHEGQHYFSMRLINGRSLVHNRGQFHEPKAAARLIAVVARAVHFAHQRGILHRDLKPSNILIDPEGNPHLTDFGLAKLIEGKGEMTQSSAILGTPDYMAPEQAMGKAKHLTTAADVFSLGVVLYEMIIGFSPFRAETPLKTIQQVIEAEPRRPSSINNRIDRDLETICLKCLEKSPERRYGSAEALAEDLERWLRNEPISARSITRLERAAKWTRRRPAAASLACLIVLSICGFVVITATNRARLRRERDTADAARQEAETQRELAETNFSRARQAVETYLVKVTENPKLKEVDLLLLRKELLETAIPFYEEIVLQSTSDPKITVQQGDALLKLCSIYGALGERLKAEEVSRRAVEIHEKLATDFPREPSFRASLAASLRAFGGVFEIARPAKEAKEAYCRAVEILEKLATEFPTLTNYRDNLASSYKELGVLLGQTGEFRKAAEALRQAGLLREQLATNFPTGSEKNLSALAASQNDFGLLLMQAGRTKEALEVRYREVQIREKLAADFPGGAENSPLGLAVCHGNLGGLLEKVGRTKEAEEAYRRAVQLAAKKAGDFPNLPDARSLWANELSNLGNLLQQTGRAKEAEEAYRQALKTQEKLAADFQSRTQYRTALAGSLNSFGVFLKRRGRAKEAEDAYRRAVQVYESLDADFSTEPNKGLAGSLSCNLGYLLHQTARPQEAEEAYLRAVQIGEKLARNFPAESDKQAVWAKSLSSLGVFLQQTGRAKEAEETHQRAAEIRKKLVAKFSMEPQIRVDLAVSHGNLGGLLAQIGRLQEAEQAYREALQVLENLTRDFPSSPKFLAYLAACHRKLGALLEQGGRAKEADDAYRRAAEIRKSLGTNSPTLLE